jgi:hypothetical protein
MIIHVKTFKIFVFDIDICIYIFVYTGLPPVLCVRESKEEYESGLNHIYIYIYMYIFVHI